MHTTVRLGPRSHDSARRSRFAREPVGPARAGESERLDPSSRSRRRAPQHVSRERARGRPGQPLSSPSRDGRRVDAAPRAGEPGDDPPRRQRASGRGRMAWPALRRDPRARRVRTGVALARPPRERRRGRGAGRSRPRARPGARPLRRRPHQRVLRQSVRRLRAALASRPRDRAGGAAEPRDGRAPPVGRGRRARAWGGVRDRRPRPARPDDACRRRARRARGAETPGAPAAARAFDGGAPGCPAGARAGCRGRARILRLVRGGPSRGDVGCRPGLRRPRHGASRSRDAGAVARARDRRASRGDALFRASDPRDRDPRGARADDVLRTRAPASRVGGWCRALLLRGPAPPRRARRQGAAEPPPARTHPPDRRRPRARRGFAHLDGVDGRRLPLDGHAGAREHQSLALDGALLSRARALERPPDLRRARRRLSSARRAVGLRDHARRLRLALQARVGCHPGREPRGHEPTRADARDRGRDGAAAPLPVLAPRGGRRRRRRRGHSRSHRGGLGRHRRADRSRERARTALPGGLLPHRSRSRDADRTGRGRRGALRRRPLPPAAVPRRRDATQRGGRLPHQRWPRAGGCARRLLPAGG